MTKDLVPKPAPKRPARAGGYDRLLGQIIEEVNQARHLSARVVNTAMTATYWLIGHHIVEFEQAGAQRAEYGEALLKKMAIDLTAKFGKGFSLTNLKQFRQFYLTFPQGGMGQTASGRLPGDAHEIGQTASDLSSMRPIGASFSLPWSAYVRLLSVKDETALPCYEAEANPAGYSAGLDTATAGGYTHTWICSPLDQPQGLRRGFAFRGLPCR